MSDPCYKKINTLAENVRRINKHLSKCTTKTKCLLPAGPNSKIGSENNKFSEIWVEELFVNNETI